MKKNDEAKKVYKVEMTNSCSDPIPTLISRPFVRQQGPSHN